MTRLLCIFSVLALACGDDDSAPDAGNDAGADAPMMDVQVADVPADEGPADDATSADATSVDAPTPVDAGPTTDLSVVCIDIEGAGIEGVTLAFDAADGTRTEGVSDADGRFVFSGVRWGEGADITGVPPTTLALGASSYAGFTQAHAETLLNDDGDLPLPFIFATTPAERVTVSGSFSGGSGGGAIFFVGTNAPGATQFNNNGGSGYEIEVPTGVPFRLTAIEYTFNSTARAFERDIIAVTIIDSDALTADAVIDIDVSTTETLIPVAGTMPLPVDEHALAGMGRVDFVNLSNNFRTIVGIGETFTISDDGTSFDYTGQRWTGSEAADVWSSLSINNGPLNSTVLLNGLGEGMQDTAFLDPAVVVTPAFGDFHPLHDPIVYTSIHPEFSTNVAVGDEDRTVLWAIIGTPGATEITVPQLPTGISEADVLGEAPLTGRLQICDPIGEPPRVVCRRQAFGRVFDFAR